MIFKVPSNTSHSVILWFHCLYSHSTSVLLQPWGAVPPTQVTLASRPPTFQMPQHPRSHPPAVLQQPLVPSLVPVGSLCPSAYSNNHCSVKVAWCHITYFLSHLLSCFTGLRARKNTLCHLWFRPLAMLAMASCRWKRLLISSPGGKEAREGYCRDVFIMMPSDVE